MLVWMGLFADCSDQQRQVHATERKGRNVGSLSANPRCVLCVLCVLCVNYIISRAWVPKTGAQKETTPSNTSPLNFPPLRMSVVGKLLYFWFTYSALSRIVGAMNQPPAIW
jgi:hypothetical protein